MIALKENKIKMNNIADELLKTIKYAIDLEKHKNKTVIPV